MLLAVALVLVGATSAAVVVEARSSAATNASALAARWHGIQTCRDARSGDGMAITSNTELGKAIGLIGFAMRVSMGFATARGIAQRVGPGEFQPAGTHGAAAQSVPCNVALDVASRAGNTWGARQQRRFAITAGWAGYSGGPQFGFECLLRTAGARALAATCVHRASRQEGTVRVRFLIHGIAESA